MINIFNMSKKERIAYLISEDKDFSETISSVERLFEYMESFDFLQFGRDLKFTSKNTFSPSSILTSATKTLLSIISCLEYGNISDAYILLRRFSEDIFLYLYIEVKYNKSMASNAEDFREDKIVKGWLDNSLIYKNFNTDVLREISKNRDIRAFSIKFNLEKKFDSMREKMNKYVHWNGRKYYNNSSSISDSTNHVIELQELVQILEDYVYYFTILLSLIKPLTIMSSDYSDYVEMEMPPPENGQYWVVPFVDEFLDKHSSKVGDESYGYFKSLTLMQLK